MAMGKGITILGLGPGNPELLTCQASQLLESISEIYLRTEQHPVVAGLPNHIDVHSFDYLYEDSATFEAVYRRIVDQVITLGGRPDGVVYAVPGHPLVAEATTPEIVRWANKENLPVRIVEGLSFLEPTFTALGLDPFPSTALVDALDLSVMHVPPFPPNFPAIICQIHSEIVASEVKLTLMNIYPDEHPVALVHAAGTELECVENLALYQIDRSRRIGLLTSLYVPPLEGEASFEAFQDIIARLRAPDGCPWDREQTHLSLRSHLLEETYEVLATLDHEDSESLKEELGDLLLQILLHAQIATESGEFTMNDVLAGIHTKIVRRHPHVFGGVQVDDTQGVLLNWERLKAEERNAEGKNEASLLDGVAMALPAMLQAEEYQKRAARVGFDWHDVQGVWEKLREEIAELEAANGEEEKSHEIGDLLFTMVNLARWYKIDPESALRDINSQFYRRFTHIERAARERGHSVADLSLDEMEAWGQQAKGKGAL
jgi:tetrapyrrole methylase family protein/MazG family protein